MGVLHGIGDSEIEHLNLYFKKIKCLNRNTVMSKNNGILERAERWPRSACSQTWSKVITRRRHGQEARSRIVRVSERIGPPASLCFAEMATRLCTRLQMELETL